MNKNIKIKLSIALLIFSGIMMYIYKVEFMSGHYLEGETLLPEQSPIRKLYGYKSFDLKNNYKNRESFSKGWVIKPKFLVAGNFSEGYAAVKSSDNDLWGWIDKNGKYINEPKYQMVGKFSEGIASICARYTNDWGFVDTTGTVIIPMKYDFVSDFSCGFAVVYLNKTVGLIDKKGQVIFPFREDWNYIGNVKENDVLGYIAAIKTLDNKEAVIDISGEYLIPPQKESLRVRYDGMIERIHTNQIYNPVTRKFEKRGDKQ